MQYELDNFWGNITIEAPSDYERMNATIIHNPAIRYFQMVLAQTFFEKNENTDTINKEEPFIMFTVFQSRPIHSATFLLSSLNTIANSTREYIHVGEIVTSIALAIGLCDQVIHLTPLRELTLIDVNQWLNKKLVRVKRPNEFELLIHNEVIHYFYLPNREKTSIHNRDN